MDSKEIKKAKPVQWHEKLAVLLKKLLGPLGIEVHSGVSVMSLPPETDILLKSNRQSWSDEQLQCLPDGIRDTKASNIIIEFKYSESVNLRSFRQIVSYDHHYKNTHKLSEDDVADFILRDCNKIT